MKSLRALSLVIGCGMVMHLIPAFILAFAMTYQSEVPLSPGSILMGEFEILAAGTSGFFFIGICGDRILQSLLYRSIAAVLLAIPICFLGKRFITSFQLVQAIFSMPIFLGAILLFSAFAWPAWLNRSR